MKKERVKLTGAEKSELFAEGVVTVVLLLLLNLSIIILIHLAILQDESLVNGIYFLKKTITFAGGYHLWSWQNVFIVLMGVGDLVVLYWRLIRRYHQMQLRHIILELHYIANGHFDHRINFRVRPELQRVVDSINSLVDSTVNSINEERAIEQSKDELITNVSHDIRTPLISIIGYLGLLQAGVTSPEDHKKYVNIAYTKAEQMKALANDLFEYTTLKSTNTKLNLNDLHIYSMLEQVAAGFELEAEKNGIHIDYSLLEERLGCKVAIVSAKNKKGLDELLMAIKTSKEQAYLDVDYGILNESIRNMGNIDESRFTVS